MSQRRGWTVISLIIIAGATLFLFKTGSKTTFVLIASCSHHRVAAVDGRLARRHNDSLSGCHRSCGGRYAGHGLRSRNQRLRARQFSGMTAGLNLAVCRRHAAKPLMDAIRGFESFWKREGSANTMLAFDEEWDACAVLTMRTTVTWTFVLTLGLPALGALVMICIVEPVWNYLHVSATQGEYLPRRSVHDDPGVRDVERVSGIIPFSACRFAVAVRDVQRAGPENGRADPTQDRMTSSRPRKGPDVFGVDSDLVAAVFSLTTTWPISVARAERRPRS